MEENTSEEFRIIADVLQGDELDYVMRKEEDNSTNDKGEHGFIFCSC